MNINKNIAVWRGNNVPPTIYHIWIKDDNSIWLYEEDKWENFNSKNQETLLDIYEILYNQHSQIDFSSNATIIEKGIPFTINLNWIAKFNGDPITPKYTILKSGNTTLVEHAEYYTEVISDTKKYDLTIDLDYGIQKQLSLQVNAYYPMFFGSSESNNINSLSFIKQDIKSTPVGNYSLDVQNNQYVWLCVPENMNINKVLSNELIVPMEDPIMISFPGKGTYKCYRSSNAFKSGIFNFTIL